MNNRLHQDASVVAGSVCRRGSFRWIIARGLRRDAAAASSTAPRLALLVVVVDEERSRARRRDHSAHHVDVDAASRRSSASLSCPLRISTARGPGSAGCASPCCSHLYEKQRRPCRGSGAAAPSCHPPTPRRRPKIAFDTCRARHRPRTALAGPSMLGLRHLSMVASETCSLNTRATRRSRTLVLPNDVHSELTRCRRRWRALRRVLRRLPRDLAIGRGIDGRGIAGAR